MKAFLDTHAAVLLAAGETEPFGPRSRDLLERCALFISPIVRLELAFLQETGKIKVTADTVVGALEGDRLIELSKDDMTAVVAKAMDLSWTRDPFDRLLVATAILHHAPFITRDQEIQNHYGDAIW